MIFELNKETVLNKKYLLKCNVILNEVKNLHVAAHILKFFTMFRMT